MTMRCAFSTCASRRQLARAPARSQWLERCRRGHGGKDIYQLSANTGRRFDRLQDVFEPGQLFMDVDNIAPGLDFVRELHERFEAAAGNAGPMFLGFLSITCAFVLMLI